MPIFKGKGVSDPPVRANDGHTTTRRTARNRLPAAAVIFVVLVSACDAEGEPETRPSPATTEPKLEAPHTSAPTTPATPRPATTSPTPTIGADEAAGDAVAAMKSYLQTVNALSLDQGLALTELESVATDDALEWATYTVSSAREQGWTVIGERTFNEIEVTQVQLDPAESGSDYPAVHLDACLDSSAVDALDEDGDSVLPAARPTRLTTHWTVWRIDGEWVVAKTGFFGETAEAEPCA